MRGLTIIVADRSTERFRAALTLAAAQAALGARARIFLQGEAAALLHPPIHSRDDVSHVEAGLPTLAQLFEEALDLGVEIIACQSGLLFTKTDATALDPRIAFGGPVSILQTLSEDRLLGL